MQEWFLSLFGFTEGAVELRACPNERGAGRTPCIFTRDVADAEQFVRRWDKPGYGVYFGVCTRKADTNPPGTIATTAEMPAAWVDLDKIKETGPLLGAYMPPSIITDSGGGLHAYWLFNEPEDITEATSNDHPMVDLLRRLAQVFSGDRAVCDLARIMRLPGTHNSKYGEAREVRIIHQTDVRYSVDDLREWLSWQRELIGNQSDPFIAAAERLGVRPGVDVEEQLAAMSYPDNVHDVQLRVSASLLGAGKGEDEIVAVLLDATRLAAGEAGRGWNWRKEEAEIRGMCRSAEKKFQVVDLGERRRKTANGSSSSVETSDDKASVLVRVARVALEAWARPIITVDGELWTYERGIWHAFDPAWEHKLRVHIQGAVEALKVSPSNSTLNGAYRWIYERPELVRTGIEWDRAGVIVGANGAMEIETGRIVPHSELHYATRALACDLDPAATCPRWLDFLNSALPENAVGTLQEWFGGSLVRGKAREITKGLIVYGPSRTGKTQIADVMRALLGGGTCGMRVRAMSERFGMQPLVYASGWIADDAVSQHEVMDAEAYKVIVTGESISVERKNKTNVEVQFDMPVLLTMNNFPVVKDSSDAVYNRTLVLPMTAVRSECDALPIARTVIAEELAGVLNWALSGINRLKARGWYEPPAAMLAASTEFQGGNNPIGEFAALCVRLNPDRMVLREDFRAAFNAWLKTEIQARSEWSGKAVAQAIANGMPKVKGDKVHKGRVWVGMEFTTDALPYLNGFGQMERSLDDINLGLPAELRERHHPRKRTVF